MALQTISITIVIEELKGMQRWERVVVMETIALLAGSKMVQFSSQQAILTDERLEPWNEDRKQVRSLVTMTHDDNILDMQRGDSIASLQIQLVPGVPNSNTLWRGIQSFLQVFQDADEEAMIVPREMEKKQMISVARSSRDFPRKLEDIEK